MEGTVASVSTTTGEVTIKTANGISQTYKTNSNVFVSKFSTSSAKLTDIRPGDYVRGMFDGTQDTVIQLSVRETQLVHTNAMDTAANSITIADTAGTVKSFGLFGMPIHRNGSPADMASIKVDEPLLMTFIGTSLESIQIVDAVRGKVSSVDVTGGKITLTDYANATQVIELGANPVVKSGGTVLPSIAVLNPEDRIEIVKNPNGSTTVLILTAQQKSIYLYNPTDNEMSFMRSTVSERQSYPLHAKAYIHQGTQTIAPASLSPGETVNVYFLNDKIVEIAKP
jgi:hypothetical protein